jgi:hypothetical protein
VLVDRGGRKLTRSFVSLPMYTPARESVGANLRIATGHSVMQLTEAIDGREVLPAREVSRGGNRSPLNAPPLWAYELQPGELVTDGSLFHGYIVDDTWLISDVSVDHRSRSHAWRSFTQMKRLPPRTRLDRTVSLVTGGGSGVAYFHWLYDVLPRLHLLESAGLVGDQDIFLVEHIGAEYKRSTLDILGIGPDRRFEIRKPITVEAGRLVVSEGHRSLAHVEPWVPEFLRSRLMRTSPAVGRRLYINRRDTRLRRILNEHDLESALAARGFESISMVDYGFAEKVQLYASAEIIVAPHGSGLSNIAFCAPQTAILDIQGDDWFGPLFEDVARAVDLDYNIVKAARTVSPPWLPDIVRHLEVDVEAVVGALDDLIR